MNRIDRLSAILIQLQSKRKIKAQEIADKFNISLRTVYRDVRSLEEAGVPILGEAGVGYQLMEGYRLPPVMFTEEEASALLTGAKFVKSFTDELLWKQYDTALDKIKAVLRLSEKDFIEEIEQHVAVVPSASAMFQPKPELHLPKLLKALATSLRIEISYTSSSKKENLQREVEPVGIYYKGGYWYLIGYCHLRKDYRNFRTDNISKLSVKSQKFLLQHPPLAQFINKTAKERQVDKIVIDVDKRVVSYFGEQKFYFGFVNEEDRGDQVRMTFLSSALEGFARWFLLFGDQASVVEPLSLNDTISRIATNIIDKIKRAEPVLA